MPAADAAAQLSALERELGLSLADGDRLTPAGRRLAAHGGRMLVQLEAAESDAAAVANRASGVLRVGVGAAAGRALLPDVLATLRTTAPELLVRVEQLADERAGMLGADRLDMAVVGEFAAAVPRRADARAGPARPAHRAAPGRGPGPAPAQRGQRPAGRARGRALDRRAARR